VQPRENGHCSRIVMGGGEIRFFVLGQGGGGIRFCRESLLIESENNRCKIRRRGGEKRKLRLKLNQIGYSKKMSTIKPIDGGTLTVSFGVTGGEGRGGR